MFYSNIDNAPDYRVTYRSSLSPIYRKAWAVALRKAERAGVVNLLVSKFPCHDCGEKFTADEFRFSDVLDPTYWGWCEPCLSKCPDCGTVGYDCAC